MPTPAWTALKKHEQQRRNDQRPEIKITTAKPNDTGNKGHKSTTEFQPYEEYPLAANDERSEPGSYPSPFDLKVLQRIRELESADPEFARSNEKEIKRLFGMLTKACTTCGDLGDWTRCFHAYVLQRAARAGNVQEAADFEEFDLRVERVGYSHARAKFTCVHCGKEEETWQVGTKAALASIKKMAFLHCLRRDMAGGVCPPVEPTSGTFPTKEQVMARPPVMSDLTCELKKSKAIMGQEWLKMAAMVAVHEKYVEATGKPLHEAPLTPNFGAQIYDAFMHMTDVTSISRFVASQGSPLQADGEELCMQPDVTQVYCDVYDMAVACQFNARSLARAVRSAWSSALVVPELGVARLRNDIAEAFAPSKERGADEGPDAQTIAFRKAAKEAQRGEEWV